MKRFAILALAFAAFGAAACDDDSPTGPDNVIAFRATMSGAEEVPPAIGAEAGATGNATITFNLTRDAGGAITAATANFVATVSNMPEGSILRAAHIHTGAAGVAGGVLIGTPLSPATAIPIVNGSATLTFNNVTVTSDRLTAVQNIIDNPAGFYFNVHSALNPGGVVRGQLVRQ